MPNTVQGRPVIPQSRVHRLTISSERDHEDCKPTRTFTQKIEKLKTFNHHGGGGNKVSVPRSMHNQLGVQVQTADKRDFICMDAATIHVLQCLVPQSILHYSVLVLAADYRHKHLKVDIRLD